MKKAFRRISGALTRKLIVPHLPPVQPPDSMMDEIARFVACEMIEGDYYEFGVFTGAQFARAYHAFARQFQSRISQNVGGSGENESREERRRLWREMRFVAVDSFQGLPALTDEDVSSDFAEGQYACTIQRFSDYVRMAGVPSERIISVEGWFDDIARRDLLSVKNVGRKAAVIWIDCDLYSSALAALSCATDLLQDGTILVFDDWFSYRGNPNRGEQRAFRQWTNTPRIAERFSFAEYQRESWKRMSFVASAASA